MACGCIFLEEMSSRQKQQKNKKLTVGKEEKKGILD